MHGPAEFEVWEERRKELMEEAERGRLVRELRGAGGHRRGRREWRLEAPPALEGRGEIPAGGWRRVLALLGVLGVPFFGAFTTRK